MRNELHVPEIPGSVSVKFGGEQLQLLPDRAIWWPQEQALIVADVHLGKGAAFRKAGLPIPSGASAKDLRRLETLFRATSAQRVLILGDFVHAKASHQPELLEEMSRWRDANAHVEMLLVRGNHDRNAGPLSIQLNIKEVEEPFDFGDVILSHTPRYDLIRPVIAGHVHPAICLRDFDGTSVRVPCFVLDGDHCALLPSFGSFTGGHVIQQQTNRKLFLASAKKVIAIPHL